MKIYTGTYLAIFCSLLYLSCIALINSILYRQFMRPACTMQKLRPLKLPLQSQCQFKLWIAWRSQKILMLYQLMKFFPKLLMLRISAVKRSTRPFLHLVLMTTLLLLLKRRSLQIWTRVICLFMILKIKYQKLLSCQQIPLLTNLLTVQQLVIFMLIKLSLIWITITSLILTLCLLKRPATHQKIALMSILRRFSMTAGNQWVEFSLGYSLPSGELFIGLRKSLLGN